MKRLFLVLAFLLLASDARAQLTTSLIAYWAFDEASGNAVDSHSTNTLTETSGTIASAAGKVGNARDFEATDTEHFTIADNAALSTGNIDFTVAVWVNLESGGADRVIVTKGDSTNLEWQLYYDTSSDRFFFAVASGNGGANYTEAIANNLGAPATATWYFIIAWHDATANTINIQVNNGTANSTAYTFGSYDSATALNVGSNSAAVYWDGLIDNMAFWKRTLTTDEKTYLYNSGNGRSYAELTEAGRRRRTIIVQ